MSAEHTILMVAMEFLSCPVLLAICFHFLQAGPTNHNFITFALIARHTPTLLYFNMVQVKLSAVAFVLAAAVIAPVVALPVILKNGSVNYTMCWWLLTSDCALYWCRVECPWRLRVRDAWTLLWTPRVGLEQISITCLRPSFDQNEDVCCQRKSRPSRQSVRRWLGNVDISTWVERKSAIPSNNLKVIG